MTKPTSRLQRLGRSKKTLVAGALALALVASVSTFASESSGTLEVAAFVDKPNASTPEGEPLSDVSYSIENADEIIESETDIANPEGDINELKPGTYEVTVTAPDGYVLASGQEKVTVTITGNSQERVVIKYKESAPAP